MVPESALLIILNSYAVPVGKEWLFPQRWNLEENTFWKLMRGERGKKKHKLFQKHMERRILNRFTRTICNPDCRVSVWQEQTTGCLSLSAFIKWHWYEITDFTSFINNLECCWFGELQFQPRTHRNCSHVSQLVNPVIGPQPSLEGTYQHVLWKEQDWSIRCSPVYRCLLHSWGWERRTRGREPLPSPLRVALGGSWGWQCA